jgi:PadR family transcriptional regulator, regulatory protein PadR
MEALRGHLELLLLAALADGPAHGYVLIERLRERSGGEFEFAEGTIYPALHKLERAGLLGSRWADAGGRRRRVYSLTRRGRAALERRTAEWGRFAKAIDLVLGGAA